MKKPVLKTRKPLTRGQVAIEYILLLGGVIILVAVTSVFMQDVLFKPNKADIENKTQQLQELRNQLNTTQSTRPTPRVLTGTPTPSPSLGSGTPTPAGGATATPLIGTITPAPTATPGPSVTPVPSTDPSLVLYLPLDETSGSTFSDFSPSGINDGQCSFSTCPTLNQAGVKGKAVSYDGFNDNIRVPNAASLNPAQAITVMAWINIPPETNACSPSNFECSRTILAKAQDNMETEGWVMSTVQQRLKVTIAKQPQAETTSPTVIPANAWHYVAFTYDNSEGVLRLYVDGNLDTSFGGSANRLMANGNPVSNIREDASGGNKDPKERTFKGLLDEIKMFKRVLSPAEIRAEFEARPATPPASAPTCAQSGGVCVAPGPAFYGLPGSMCSNGGQPTGTGPFSCPAGSATICCSRT